MGTGIIQTNPLGRILITRGPAALREAIAKTPTLLNDPDALKDLAGTLDHYALALEEEGVSGGPLMELRTVADLIAIHGQYRPDELIAGVLGHLERVAQEAQARARMQRLSIWGDPAETTAALREALSGTKKTKMELWGERLEDIGEEKRNASVDSLYRFAWDEKNSLNLRRSATHLIVWVFVKNPAGDARGYVSDLVRDHDNLFDATAMQLMWDMMRESADRRIVPALHHWLDILYKRNPQSPRIPAEMREIYATLGSEE